MVFRSQAPQRRNKKYSVIFTLIFAAIPLSSHSRELISGKYLKTKKHLVKNDEKSRKVLKILFELASKQKKVVNRKRILSNEVLGAKERVRASIVKTRALKSHIKERDGFLKKRLRAAYMMSGDGIFRMLFSSDGVHNLYENLKYSSFILKNDIHWINQQRENLTELKEQEAKLQNQLAKYKKLEAALTDKKSELDRIQSLRVKVLKKIKQNRAKHLYSLQQMRALSQELGLREYGLDVFETAFFEEKGKLGWPTNSKIAKAYGVVKNKEFGFSWKQKGIRFLNLKSGDVRSIFKGRVVHAGELMGIGLTVIVSHGDHYYTVYGSNFDINVKKGDQVSSAEIIATIATSNDPNLGAYFEVRHFSDALNPLDWLDGSKQLLKN